MKTTLYTADVAFQSQKIGNPTKHSKNGQLIKATTATYPLKEKIPMGITAQKTAAGKVKPIKQETEENRETKPQLTWEYLGTQQGISGLFLFV